MAPFLEIVAVAFGYQLAVLPGEKVQFIIAGLSTRFRPLVVVTAASSAFAGWTVLEIVFGAMLTRVLPGLVIDGLTAALFLLFAALLVRSAPEDDPTDAAEPRVNLDRSVGGVDLGNRFGGFVPIFAMLAAGEFGDKTQLVTIGLAAQYGAHPGIWIGEMLAIVPMSAANAYLFHHLVDRLDLRMAHFLGAGLFLFFGFDTVLSMVTGVSVWDLLVSGVAGALLSSLH